MMNQRVILTLLFLIPTLSWGQDFGIKFSGFVKTDVIYDSRQGISARQGHYYLYPEKKVLDPNGEDINAKSTFHILSIQTRLKGMITGPDAMGAKTSGMIEAEFFGNIEQNINTFRLRHAYVMLNWPSTELMVGQFWHPMFITECFPGVVSFNTGAPFQPFARHPQIRLTQTLGRFSIVATALSEIDFVTNGPDGASSKYIRNAAFPELNLKGIYLWKNETTGHEILLGAAGNYKKVVPRLKTDQGYKDGQEATGMAWMGFLKVKLPALTFNFEYAYGENMYSMTMLGGYAVKEVTDLDKDYREYTPVKTMSAWTDIHTNGKTWQVGIFGGYSRNLGSEDVIAPVVVPPALSGTQIFYSRGSDIDHLYRVAPRLIYNPGRVRLAAEIEYTVAAYGTPDSKGKVENAEEVGNFRFLLGTYIFF